MSLLSPVITLNNTGITGYYSGTNGFVVKYDLYGSPKWATQIGGFTGPNVFGFGITTDSSDKVYVTGQFSDESINIYSTGIVPPTPIPPVPPTPPTPSPIPISILEKMTKNNSDAWQIKVQKIIPKCKVYEIDYICDQDEENV